MICDTVTLAHVSQNVKQTSRLGRPFTYYFYMILCDINLYVKQALVTTSKR